MADDIPPSEEKFDRRHLAKGRRPALTPELQDRFCELVREGNYAVIAAQACGVHVGTYHEWRKKGRAQESGIYHDFDEAIKKAEAGAVTWALGVVRKAAESGVWQAACWWLERSHRDKYGRQEDPATTKLQREKLTEEIKLLRARIDPARGQSLQVMTRAYLEPQNGEAAPPVEATPISS